MYLKSSVHICDLSRSKFTPIAQFGEGAALPCLFISNSIEHRPKTPLQPIFQAKRPLSPHYRKAAVSLAWNVQNLADKYGIEHLGFLTLTFSDHVLNVKEASKRLNSLASNVLNVRYVAWIRVLERQKSGRIHYHLVVVLPSDIRTGVCFPELAAGQYRSAPKTLRDEWSFWRNTAKLYKFGRTELLPVVSNAEAISRYVGKYLGKHLDAREEQDKSARLVSCSKSARFSNTRFAWATPESAEYRAKTRSFAQAMFRAGRIPSPTMEGLKLGLGPRWGFDWSDIIARWPISSSSSSVPS